MLETQRMTKDGRVVDVALSAAPLVDPASDEVIGEICSMRDITEHKLIQLAERELEQNRQLTHAIQSRLEEERRSIARELHDELGQCVTAIKTIGTAIANRTQASAPDTQRQCIDHRLGRLAHLRCGARHHPPASAYGPRSPGTERNAQGYNLGMA
jgi:signal transduction histidine kinase